LKLASEHSLFVIIVGEIGFCLGEDGDSRMLIEGMWIGNANLKATDDFSLSLEYIHHCDGDHSQFERRSKGL